MQKYEIFKRTWWKINPLTKQLEPHAGRKTHVGYAYSIEEARAKCERYNSTDKAVLKSKTGLKYEFQSV